MPSGQTSTSTGRRVVAISPSGRHVVYVANSHLYLRAMDQIDVVPIPGTEGSVPTMPTFSPDGQWVAFFSNRDRQFQKIALSGGPAVRLFDTANLFGATWGLVWVDRSRPSMPGRLSASPTAPALRSRGLNSTSRPTANGFSF